VNNLKCFAVLTLTIFSIASSARAVEKMEWKCKEDGNDTLMSVEAVQNEYSPSDFRYDIKSELKLQSTYATLLAVPSQYVTASLLQVGSHWVLKIRAVNKDLPATNRNSSSQDFFTFTGSTDDLAKGISGFGVFNYRSNREILLRHPQFTCHYGNYQEAN